MKGQSQISEMGDKLVWSLVIVAAMGIFMLFLHSKMAAVSQSIGIQ
jgi:hypothetical protein